MAIFRASDLPDLPSGKTYQLWLIFGGTARSAGVLGQGGQRQALLDDVGGWQALGLTGEPAARGHRAVNSCSSLV